MINFMVLNIQPNTRHSKEDLLKLLNVQIHNSLDLGWNVKDIVVYSNFDYEFMDVKTTNVGVLNSFCLTGSKMFGLLEFMNRNTDYDMIWSHDLDAWQNIMFEPPEIKDVGLSEYSRPKFNGGSIFWRPTAKDILINVKDEIMKHKQEKEEPTLNRVLKNYPDRVTTLNYSYNVGCSGFTPRYLQSIKPIHVCHFHPTNFIAWETHVLDRTGVGCSLTPRLEVLIRNYYPQLAKELSSKGKLRREQKLKELPNEIKKYQRASGID